MKMYKVSRFHDPSQWSGRKSEGFGNLEDTNEIWSKQLYHKKYEIQPFQSQNDNLNVIF